MFSPGHSQRRLVPFVTEEFDALITYLEPLWPNECRNLDQRRTERLSQLRKEYAPFGFLMAAFTRWPRMVGTPLPEPPLSNRLPPQSPARLAIPAGVLDARGYRELLDAAVTNRDKAMSQFRSALNGDEAQWY